MDIEEFYFDDVIHPNMFRDKHMRLQTTLGLDTNIGDTTGNYTETPDGKPRGICKSLFIVFKLL